MKYLLDTNACIQVLRAKGSPLVKQRLATHPPSDVVVCALVLGELRYGAEKSQNPPAEHARVDAFLAPYQSLPFDDGAARRYAELRALLEAQGQQLDDLDLMIAAITLVHDLTLVTHNTGHFARIAGLKLEDWEVP
jgi:tRNA(fMet)-specific endonuclease VapC